MTFPDLFFSEKGFHCAVLAGLNLLDLSAYRTRL